MATLVHPGKLSRTYWVDPNGKRVRAGTPGAIQKTWTNKTYYIQYRNNGRQQYVAAYKDKSSSLSKLGKLVTALERGEEGLINPFKEHLERPVMEHLAEYLPVLRQSATNDKYFQECDRILRAMLRECRIRTLSDLTAERIENYLSHFEAAPGTKKKHFAAMSGFAKWLAKHDRIPQNFMLKVEPPVGSAIRQFRSLNVDELRLLIEVARTRPLKDAMTVRRGPRRGELTANVKPHVRERLEQKGTGRALLYKTALYTGLRKEELARVRVGHIDWAAKPSPQIRMPADCTKNKQPASPWLPLSLAEEIREWIQKTGRGDSDPLFDVPNTIHRSFAKDLQAAGIPERTERGVARFRSLRKSANVVLRGLGYDLKARQLFMRHSDVRLTADTYDDGSLQDMAEMAQSIEGLGL